METPTLGVPFGFFGLFVLRLSRFIDSRRRLEKLY